jgi:O-methyltransferase involved in polyketide biosynthesis
VTSQDAAAGGLPADVPERTAEPSSFDMGIAHSARVYDYWLGGKDNYQADRDAGDQVMETIPNVREGARANRAFLHRAVQYLVREAGIRQFLDIGTGLPTAENTHQVAQSIAPESRIVYVDYDPIVLAHARALLDSTPQGATAYIEADARDTDLIVREAARTLDFSQPVAIMALLILQYIPDADDPHGVISRLLDAVPSGSYLTISDTTTDIDSDRVAAGTARLNTRMGPAQSTPRPKAEIARYFDGLELIEPGISPMPQWRNPDESLVIHVFAGVGRKP